MAGLFDNIFGNAGGMYADMLSPEQQAAMRRQGMLQVAAKLLEGSGPSPVRRTLGQTLGSALGAGAEAMQSGQTNAIQQMLLKQKLDEAKMTAKQREDFNEMLTGAAGPAPAPSPLTASQAILAPQASAGRPGPTLDRASLMDAGSMPMPTGSMPTGSMPAAPMPAAPLSPSQSALMAPRPGTAQPVAAGAAPQTLQDFLRTQPPAYLQSLQGMSQSDAMKSIQERMTQSIKFGKPEFYMRDGNLVAKRFNELGGMQEVPGLAPRDAPTSSIAEYQFAVSQGYKGGFEQFDQSRRRSGASQQTVNMGDTQFGTQSQDTMRIPDPNAPGGYRLINLEGGKGDLAAKDAERQAKIGSQVTRDAAQTVFEDSGRAIAQLDKYGGQVSGFGALTSFIPGSAAKEFEGHIFSIKSNIGIDQLLKIKASGAGLGAIPQSQLEMLASLLGNLDAKQNTTVLRENILRIQEIYQDIVIKEGGDPLKIARSRGFTFPGDQNPRTLRQTLDTKTKTIEEELRDRGVNP